MNLYFYIPPHSTHPPRVLTGIVSSNIIRIHLLYSKQDDINRHIKVFYDRLLVCRYQSDFLIPTFSKVIMGANAFIKRVSLQRCVLGQDKDTQGCVFFHLTYNRRNPTSKILQRQWHQHLLHPLWEPPLWRLKKKYRIPIGIN